DLPENGDVQSAVRTMYEDGKVVAAVCHGPAAFVNVKLSDGSWLVNGKTLSTFTDDEERAVEKDEIVPFLLENKLRERGATIDKAENFEASVSVDQRIVTGQNPASARGVGEAIRDLIKERDAKAA
ncbi:MAG: type 1 glutamine amidotransferase domain-containing protein, partial [Woeseiaceae bacterium]|nr:type 1 glutamine amidotransferase domain-containing protein [Woeseiaceae bacterium]